MPKVTKIAPKVQAARLLRVAAYARVSCGKDAMLHSLSAQVSQYSRLIQSHSGWQYVGVYADEATTGTKDDRADFQRLLDDCRAGKIDMVITKSVSRFARNTVILLSTVRELKALGIDVYFEEQNIHSTSADGELMLTILASFAQEESLSVSENCKWSIREKFKKGEPSFFRCYGYRWVEGQLQVVPEEAAVVKRIFEDYLSGMGLPAICRDLDDAGIPSREGGKWTSFVVYYILRNERYIGDLLLQKEYVTDHISKKKVRNHGELPQYYVSDAHEPIISREVFEAVQEETERRRQKYAPKDGPTIGKVFPFTGKLNCCTCGGRYRRKMANCGSKYVHPIWICNTFNKNGKAACASKQIPESTLFDTVAGVLGLPEFDADIFDEVVDHIDVTGPNLIRVCFKDGSVKDAAWHDRSRKKSWTPEMRARAAEYARKGHESKCQG